MTQAEFGRLIEKGGPHLIRALKAEAAGRIARGEVLQSAPSKIGDLLNSQVHDGRGR